MAEQNDATHAQSEMQTRIARRRIDEIKKILNSGVQAPSNSYMDKDAEAVVARLYDTSLSEADISSCISILAMLLSLDGLLPLFDVMKNESYSINLRKQAAEAIAQIGSGYLAKELKELSSCDSKQLRSLAEIALKGTT